MLVSFWPPKMSQKLNHILGFLKSWNIVSALYYINITTYWMVKIFSTRKVLKAKDKLNVIFWAYNSLTDFSRQRVGTCSVAG